jgi:hypothetical protein
VDKDVRREGLSVSIDIEIIRKYGITLQELPLLCRLFLIGQRKAGSQVNLTYGESEMNSHRAERAEAGAQMLCERLRGKTRQGQSKSEPKDRKGEPV